MDTNRAELRGWVQVLVTGVLVTAALAGCGATTGNGPPGPSSTATGGSGGTGNTSAAGNSTELAGAGAGVAGARSTCPGPSPAPITATGRVDVLFQLTVNHDRLTLGSPIAGLTGLEYKLSAFELFLAEPALLDANGQEVKAQIVDPAGKPLPYAIQLFNADDPATQVLRLAAPSGAYSALRFGVGVPADCNAVSATGAVYPLNPDSEMFWAWGSQFLFIRIEGAIRTPPATDFTTFFHHVGYDQAYAHVTVPGSISAAEGVSADILSLDVDRLLTGGEGTTNVAPSGSHSVPEGWLVDNLETQPVFSLQ
jgi:hypothetical protein